MEQKYYWCSYVTEDSRAIGSCKEIALDRHPFLWVKAVNKTKGFWNSKYIILNYKEISKEEYNLWNQQ